VGEEEGVCKKLSQPHDGRVDHSTFFYRALNKMSKSMIETTTGGTFMGKEIDIATEILNDMQDVFTLMHN
jgi:hypothetical protein